ncbi:ferritin [candidate division KSB3 bacterium]|uniref:Ferritin n=1 Tax=candidate division KSB3 bacterium TaxID=2044937 RepID=A0A2G6E516_9BACT|nr:MAG: ferritin [candidate division KSB3 bacterium]PIE29809.1 MAG: ferritin [candidate division KSB3 bacterium]
MLSKRMEEALNKQVTAEFYSSYLYLSMSADFAAKNLEGFASWMQMQAQEEWDHGMKIYNYILEKGGTIKLEAIKAPPTSWKNAVDAFDTTLKHEQHVTGLFNNLASLAIEEKDHATGIFLQWFVSEQVEEESTASGILERLKMVGDSPQGLFMMDSNLAARQAFTASAAAE